MTERDEINLYYDGVKEGLWKYAHWQDGVQYVGNCGTTLKEAYDKVEQERSRLLLGAAFA